MQLKGLHHLTAVTADAPGCIAFYTGVMGLRLVKKTVNQDDVSAYHLFFADAAGTPGTDITFFHWRARREERGTGSVVRTGFRVGSKESLVWWEGRLSEHGVTFSQRALREGRTAIDFEDPEGQRLSLTVDEAGTAVPWRGSPVPEEHQVRGLGPVILSVPDLAAMERLLSGVLQMVRTREETGPDNTVVAVWRMEAEGAAGEIQLLEEKEAGRARAGAGGVHHVALRVPDKEAHDWWLEHLAEKGVRTSGAIDRFYFRSLYFREPNGILFEIATDGPGFAVDESAEKLGERLSLPPFLEGRRAEIEAGLPPLAKPDVVK